MVKVSIIMGIYNCEMELEKSIESILNQTYENWELIMCDDGSSDGTYEVAKRYKQKWPTKIVLLKNKVNKGLNYTLNKCAKYANGEYIARQDADDISYYNRLEKQVKILDENQDIAVVSSNMTLFNDKGVWGITNFPEYPEKKDFIKGNPFAHPTSIYRKSVFNKVGGYSEGKDLIRIEDYHLWFKMYKLGYKGVNVVEPLGYYRDDYAAAKRRNLKNRVNEMKLRLHIYKEFDLPKIELIAALKPLVFILIPTRVYYYLRMQSREDNRK